MWAKNENPGRNIFLGFLQWSPDRKLLQISCAMFSALFWNIRGVCTSRRRIKRLIRLNNVSVLAVFEPMVSFDQVLDFQKQIKFEGCLSFPFNKIWLLWRHGLTCRHIFSNDQFILVEVLSSSGRLLSFLTVIYAKCTQLEHILL